MLILWRHINTAGSQSNSNASEVLSQYQLISINTSKATLLGVLYENYSNLLYENYSLKTTLWKLLYENYSNLLYENYSNHSMKSTLIYSMKTTLWKLL